MVDTVVSIFIGSQVIDEVLERLYEACDAPRQWIAFGLQDSLMQALDTQWSGKIYVTMVLVPARSLINREVVRSVLEAEGIPIDRCGWLSRSEFTCHIPEAGNPVMNASILNAREIALGISTWLGSSRSP